MSEKINLPQSLTDQIFDKFFDSLSKQELFDETTIEKIKSLYKNGDLKKSEPLEKTLRVKEGQR